MNEDAYIWYRLDIRCSDEGQVPFLQTLPIVPNLNQKLPAPGLIPTIIQNIIIYNYVQSDNAGATVESCTRVGAIYPQRSQICKKLTPQQQQVGGCEVLVPLCKCTVAYSRCSSRQRLMWDSTVRSLRQRVPQTWPLPPSSLLVTMMALLHF